MNIWTNRDKKRGHKVGQQHRSTVGQGTISLKRHTLLFTLRRNMEPSPYALNRTTIQLCTLCNWAASNTAQIWIKQMYLIPSPVPKHLFFNTRVFKCLICGSRAQSLLRNDTWLTEVVTIYLFGTLLMLQFSENAMENNKTRTVLCSTDLEQQVEHTSKNLSNLLRSLPR